MNRALIRAFLLLGSILAASASAQTFPSKSPTLIVPFSPGGATDVLARMLAVPLEKLLGRSFIVENRPGGCSPIAGRYLGCRAPDGRPIIHLSGMRVSWPILIKGPRVHM